MTLESTCMAIIWKNGEWLHEVLCISGPKIKALKRALKNKIGDNWNNVENKFVKGHYPVDVIMKSWGHKDHIFINYCFEAINGRFPTFFQLGSIECMLAQLLF